MLSTYNLIVDISTNDKAIDQVTFVAQVAPSLAHLFSLKEAFDRKPCTLEYYPPNAQNESQGWAVRAIVLISVGSQRGDALLLLYKSIVKLLEFELPSHLNLEAECSVFDFSS